MSGGGGADRAAVIATIVISKGATYNTRHQLSRTIPLHKNSRTGTRYPQGGRIVLKQAVADQRLTGASQHTIDRYGSSPTAIIIAKGAIANADISGASRIRIDQNTAPGSKTKRTISIAFLNNEAVQHIVDSGVHSNKYIENIIQTIVEHPNIPTQHRWISIPISLGQATFGSLKTSV